jgi:hypothetical protein
MWAAIEAHEHEESAEEAAGRAESLSAR